MRTNSVIAVALAIVLSTFAAVLMDSQLMAVALAQDAPPGFPDHTTTGPEEDECAQPIPAQPSGGIETSVDGQVIECVHMYGIGIRHDDVVIRNFRVTFDNPEQFYGIRFIRKADGTWPENVLIEDGRITSVDTSGNPHPSLAKGIQQGSNMTVRGLEISYTEDGVHCRDNCLIEGNYIHHLLPYQGSHNDGVVASSGSHIVIRGNTILLPDQQTGAVSLFPDFGPIDDVLIEDNYLNGGTYTIHSRTMDYGAPTNVRILNNHFGPDYIYGTHTIDGHVTWEGNIDGPLVGDGHMTGLVDPGTGVWRLYNQTGNLISSFFYGNPGDFPLMGDWDCDGIETPGLYRRSDGFVYLRNSNTQGVADITFFFGNPGDIPLAGDFDGDDCDTVSIYRPSEGRVFVINRLGANDGELGPADLDYYFGNPGDKPFVGDFNGNGVETIGLHRESTGFVYFRLTHTQGAADNHFFFGDPGDRLIAGDWTGNGEYTAALFRSSNTTVYYRYSNSQGNADHQWVGGQADWIPVAGSTG